MMTKTWIPLLLLSACTMPVELAGISPACDDGNPCTTDRVVIGTAGPICLHTNVCAECSRDCDCDDGNPCTADTCSSGGCQNANVEGVSCGSVPHGTCRGGWCCTAEYTCFEVTEPPAECP